MSIFSYLVSKEAALNPYPDDANLWEKTCAWMARNVYSERYWLEAIRMMRAQHKDEVLRLERKRDFLMRAYIQAAELDENEFIHLTNLHTSRYDHMYPEDDETSTDSGSLFFEMDDAAFLKEAEKVLGPKEVN